MGGAPFSGCARSLVKMPSVDTHTRELQAHDQRSFHLDIHSRPLPLRGYLVSFQHPGSPRGVSGGEVGCLKVRCITRCVALRFGTPQGRLGKMLTSSDFGRGWGWAVGEG